MGNRQSRCAYTLIEMLTTVAVLIIVLGLMISLARHVRSRASYDLTRQVLVKLETLMDQYARRHGGTVPPVVPVAPAGVPVDESAVQRSAPANNAEFVRALRRQQDLAAGIFSDLPLSVYDEVSLYDAWGSPIVLMPHGNRDIGTAPRDAFFFFSAGPDRRYLTREDNLYSYETASRGGGGEDGG